jgi:hypothetical protein
LIGSQNGGDVAGDTGFSASTTIIALTPELNCLDCG